MKRSLVILVVVAVAGGGYYAYSRGTDSKPANAGPTGSGRSGGGGRQGGGGPGGGGPGGFGGGGFGGGGGGPRPASMTVEVGPVKRADMSAQVTVVGNLIGEATVDAVARVAGRLDEVMVKLGDQVKRGQTVAKVEDREIVEQIKQAQASYDVSAATIRQREADLRLAQSNLDRNKSLFERQLISKQTFDDTDSRFQAAQAQLDLARAQYAQAAARLDELKLSLGNTIVTSPVNGFVSKRALDPGAWVTTNTSFMSFVDITTVRLVANVIEKDLRRVAKGLEANVAVDAYPNEVFKGHIARISPVLDPATRTAQIEVEIPNPQFRLRPGMYAKVDLTVENHPNTLVVPTNALVDFRGQRGVFRPSEGETSVAKFQPVEVGLSDANLSEIASGLKEGERVVTIGAGALREGDKLILASARGGGDGSGRSGRSGGGRSGGRSGGPDGSGAQSAAPGAPAAPASGVSGAPGAGGGDAQGRRGGSGGRRGGEGGRRSGASGGSAGF